MWRTGSKNGLFFVKSLYKALEQRTFFSFPGSAFGRLVYNQKLVSLQGRILTCDQLQKRGLSLASCCPLCLASEESVDHLLLHCSKTRVLWNLIFSLFGVSWILSATVKDSLLGWKGTFLAKEK